jgi:hypothetical protein
LDATGEGKVAEAAGLAKPSISVAASGLRPPGPTWEGTEALGPAHGNPVIFVPSTVLIQRYDVDADGYLQDGTAFSGESTSHCGQNIFRRCSMTFVPMMWTVWGVLVAITASVYIYRSRLTRDEEDQIFLDDSFHQEQEAQAEIVAKVNKVEPALHLLFWVVAAATLFVILYYIMDIVHQFR